MRACPPDVLIGDREREIALDRLAQAFSEGRINEFEFDGRQERALAARTHADVEGALARLPEPVIALSLATRGIQALSRRRRQLTVGLATLALGAGALATGIPAAAVHMVHATPAQRALEQAIDADERSGFPDALNGHWLHDFAPELQLAERPLKPTYLPETVSVIWDGERTGYWTHYCVAHEGVTCAAMYPGRPRRTASAPTQTAAQTAARAKAR